MFKSYAGASGSFKGTATVGTGATANAASAPKQGPGGWHPTVLYMLGLIVAEIVVVGFLSRILLK